ncbi:helix-turn-helix transcriptional regulator [Rhodobacteraceae bacterium RKSG542]|uniref:S24 family peptidase n=1 Tax=Pseudovibrio flavus TaxID=2529854 RepID=UPI0012BB9FEF|nr:helix-turn-helix transcriptional regulator [Pseudovibrio flavus]MTI18794.1 helix-turn-helix transcriptional regulator [Pseudovibrio flavus]
MSRNMDEDTTGSMLSHEAIWQGIDEVARRNQLSPSGLAKLAGLDTTSFNKSKRITADGRKRWPSTESLSKVLDVTGTTLAQFLGLCSQPEAETAPTSGSLAVPCISSQDITDIKTQGTANITIVNTASYIAFPVKHAEKYFAVEVYGNNFEPYYADGQILIVSQDTSLRRGDKVIFKRQGRDPLLRVFLSEKLGAYTFRGLQSCDPPLEIETSQLEWALRVRWASQ